MKVEIYLGTILLDYNDDINVEYSIRRLLDPGIILTNKSFTIKLPLSDTNIEAIEYFNKINTEDEVSGLAMVRIDGVEVLNGLMKIIEITDYVKVIITKTEWLEGRKKDTLQDLDLSTHDHTYGETTMNSSDSAANSFYRYPLINWGRMLGQGEISVQDRAPIFEVKAIYEAIFSDYTISSTILTNTLDDYYITSNVPINTNNFLENSEFEAERSSNDNNAHTVPGSATNFVILLFNGNTENNKLVPYNSEISDDGGNYNTSTHIYTVDQAGAFRIQAGMRISIDGSGLDNVDPVITFRVYRERDAAPFIIGTDSDSSISGTGTVSLEVDTGFLWFESGDEIYCTVIVTDTVDNPEVFAQDYDGNILDHDDTYFKATVNKWIAESYDLEISNLIPPIVQLDFIKAINHLFNLVLFIDEQAKNIYVEPSDDFYTSNEIDWTDKLDHERVLVQKMIMPDFEKNLLFKFKNDGSDILLDNYNKANILPLGSKLVEFDSVYAKDGTKELSNKELSTYIEDAYYSYYIDDNGDQNTYLFLNADIPVIFGDQNNGKFPEDRVEVYNTKIMKWEGLTSGNWTFEGGAKTTYPAVSQLDFDGASGLYASYYLVETKRMEKGKYITAMIGLDQIDINPFQVIVDTADSEGFRAKYKLKYKDNYFYGHLLKIVYDGKLAKVTFLKV